MQQQETTKVEKEEKGHENSPFRHSSFRKESKSKSESESESESASTPKSESKSKSKSKSKSESESESESTSTRGMCIQNSLTLCKMCMWEKENTPLKRERVVSGEVETKPTTTTVSAPEKEHGNFSTQIPITVYSPIICYITSNMISIHFIESKQVHLEQQQQQYEKERPKTKGEEPKESQPPTKEGTVLIKFYWILLKSNLFFVCAVHLRTVFGVAVVVVGFSFSQSKNPNLNAKRKVRSSETQKKKSKKNSNEVKLMRRKKLTAQNQLKLESSESSLSLSSIE